MNVGGVERGTLDLARSLVKLGHTAIVVSGGGELVKELESGGAIHYQLPAGNKNLISIIRCIPRLAEIIRNERIDIVHARSRVPAIISFFACRMTGVAFITTCHGYYRKHPFSMFMGWGKRVIVLSNVIARHMIDDFSVPVDRIRIIPRSVDLERFTFTRRPRGAALNVGIIGRLTPLKGHIHFIKAMARVARAYPNLKIWIVGDAPASKAAYKDHVRLLVRRLGLWHCTEFLGTQRDIPSVLSQLDLLVLSTTAHEAFGRVIIEAQACGVPVVATAVGGVVDIIEEGVNGLLVPPADPEALAGAVERILGDPDLAGAIVENARKKVLEKYTLERMVGATLDVYRETLENRKILIIKTSSLGDVILSSAAIRAIRERFPKPARVSLLVGIGSREILLRNPHIDELLVCDLKNRDGGARGLWRLGRQLRKKGFDIVVDLQNSRISHALGALTLAPQRYGYDRKWGFLLNRRLKDDGPACGPVTHQFKLLKMLGIERECPLEVWPSGEDEARVDEFLAGQWLKPNEKLIGINIGASRRWVSKIWPSQHLKKLCEELQKRNLRVVVTGAPEDSRRAEEFCREMSSAGLINASGKFTLNQLACLVRHCAAFVSGDSAPLHVAAAVGTPFVALFGPTSPERHLPPARRFVLLKGVSACAPCYKSSCKHHSCMMSIRPEAVLRALEGLLTQEPANGDI